MCNYCRHASGRREGGGRQGGERGVPRGAGHRGSVDRPVSTSLPLRPRQPAAGDRGLRTVDDAVQGAAGARRPRARGGDLAGRRPGRGLRRLRPLDEQGRRRPGQEGAGDAGRGPRRQAGAAGEDHGLPPGPGGDAGHRATGRDRGLRRDPQRRPAPQARRRRRLADGPRGHRGDLPTPEGKWFGLTRYSHLITDENRKWWTLGAMCFALFMIMLDNTVVHVALPSIQKDLGASISGLEWTINGYTLSFAVLLATGGRLGDIFGRRLMVMIGVVIFAVSSATGGFAPNEPPLGLSRVVQGVGAALMMPGTLSIITDAFPAHERGKAMGTWAGVSALALAVGPVLGGFLTEHVSWRAIFYVNIPVAVGAIIATLFAVRESRDTSVGREVDYAGVAVLTVGLTSLVLALVEGNSWGWGSAEIVGLLALAALALPAFVFVENRVKAPMVQFDLLSDRNFLAAVCVAMIISFGMLGVFFFLALYMQDILGYTPLEAGIRFLPSTLMIVGVAPVAGRLSDRFGPRWLIAIGLTIVAASLFSFSRIAVDSTYLDLLPGFMLLGIGIAMTMSPMTSAAMNAVPVQKAGIASGVLSMFRMVGGSLGVAVTGAIFQGLVTSKLGSLLSGSGVTAAQRDAVSEQLGGGSVTKVPGLTAARAKEVTTAGSEAFVYALGHAMTVSAFVALLGAAIGATAIRAKAKGHTSLEAATAEANPGGEALATEEAREAAQLA